MQNKTCQEKDPTKCNGDLETRRDYKINHD